MENQRVVMELISDAGPSSRLDAEAIDAARDTILRTFQEVKSNDRQFKRKAYQNMEERLKTAVSEYKKLEKQGKEEVRKKYPGKKNASTRNDKYKELTPKWKHEIYDPIFKTYEQKRFFGTMTLGSLLSEIQIKLSNMNPPMVAGYTVEGNTTTVQVGDRNGLGGVRAAIVYKQGGRFVKIHQGHGALSDIFKHRESQRQYVQDRYGIFIPRFLLRNLSSYDMQLFSRGLSSRDGRVFQKKASSTGARDFQEQEFIEAVVRHLRAAQQGGSYFISTTSTTKRIYGSTGRDFYTPDYGQIVIDAAHIPQDDLVDVHSPMAMTKMLGVTNYDWTLEFSETDKSYQAMAAARDAIRTREIVVHGVIPREAFTRIRSGELGIPEWVEPACRKAVVVPVPPAMIPVSRSGS